MIAQVSAFKRTAMIKSGPIDLKKGSRVQVCGPNGIGKTTFLELLAAGTAPGTTTHDLARVGYYRQDFSNLDFESTVLDTLVKANESDIPVSRVRAIAAHFLLSEKTMGQQVKTLSEGQKGLLSLACLRLRHFSVLIMDEPTNHINFRHLPALAGAIRNFKGAVLVVSHDANFVSSVGCNCVIDMGKVLGVEAKASVKAHSGMIGAPTTKPKAAVRQQTSTPKSDVNAGASEGEYRIDQSDGNWYPIESFIELYGGTAEWEAAKFHKF